MNAMYDLANNMALAAIPFWLNVQKCTIYKTM